jgi:hypothetical protein
MRGIAIPLHKGIVIPRNISLPNKRIANPLE